MSSSFGRWCACLALVLACVGRSALARERRTEPWPERVVQIAGSLPIQDGGRVKPLESVARFALLSIHGRTTFVDRDGERHDAAAWLLDLMLYPEAAAQEPLFLVEDAGAVEAAGGTRGAKSKRDRWTYEELQPCLPRLFGLAHDYGAIDAKLRTSVQTQVVRLAENVMTFLRFARALDFARHDPSAVAGPALAARLGVERLRFDEVVARCSELGTLANDDDERVARDARALLDAASIGAADAAAIAWFPPASSTEREWTTAAGLLEDARRREPPPAAQIAALKALVDVVEERDDAARVEHALASLRAAAATLDLERGELASVELESTYYRLGLLRWAVAGFVLAFVACALSWLRPAARIARSVPFALALAACGLTITAITLRCVIRERPPVTTLYETVLFVTASGVALALVTERFSRRGLFTALAALFGAAGLFLADGYEQLDARDTMPNLVAVLDTNFWLATHVTTITLGYGAGMLAAVLGTAYVLGLLVRGERFSREARADLARATYGVVCFALVASLVGTVLGGIWANESWGRFWGWDPKENGALLIVLTQLSILHARRAGLVRELGLCTAAAFGGSVVAFSWWGVNLLGVGLHSYGFTSGIQRALWTYYAAQWAVVGIGLALAWRARRRSRRASTPILALDTPARSEREAA